MRDDIVTRGIRNARPSNTSEAAHDPEALNIVLFALWEAGMIRSEALEAIRAMGMSGVVFKKTETA